MKQIGTKNTDSNSILSVTNDILKAAQMHNLNPALIDQSNVVTICRQAVLAYACSADSASSAESDSKPLLEIKTCDLTVQTTNSYSRKTRTSENFNFENGGAKSRKRLETVCTSVHDTLRSSRTVPPRLFRPKRGARLSLFLRPICVYTPGGYTVQRVNVYEFRCTLSLHDMCLFSVTYFSLPDSHLNFDRVDTCLS